MINFEVFASVSLAISGSLAIYMVIQFVLFVMSTFNSIDKEEDLRPARR